jgi:hypothetical protein
VAAAISVASGERPNVPAGPLAGPDGPDALCVEGGGDPGFELLLFEGGAVASEGGGELVVFEPPPGPWPPDPCTGLLGAGAAGPDADCELLGVLGEPPDDGLWLRASAYALGIPGNSAITNRSRTSRNIASALKKQVA